MKKSWIKFYCNKMPVAHSAMAVENTGCISAKRYDSSNECPEYDIKLSDGEASVMLQL